MYQRTKLAVLVVAALALPACGWMWPGGGYTQVPEADIVNGSFSVGARNFTPFKIVVPEGLEKIRVEGSFAAKGGSNNDIEVTLLEEIQFLNWQNRHKFIPLYESGRVTADRVSIALPDDPATYVLIFSNRFSLLSTKAVTADLKLRFERD